jgi:hypothetical protein
MNLRKNALTLALLGSALLGGAAHAGDLAQRRDLLTRSLRDGLGNHPVEVLRPADAPGVDLRGMLSSLRANGVLPAGEKPLLITKGAGGDDQGLQELRGLGWRLQVSPDGSFASFRSKTRAAEGRATAIPSARLEELGRAFIATKLKGVLRFASNETLTVLSTRERKFGVQHRDSADREVTVEGQTIVFGRRIGGVDVVGPGSKIVVRVDAAEQIVGFDYDWKAFVPTGGTQETIDLPAIKVRAATVDPAGAGGAFGPGRSLQGLECGYYDAGYRRRPAQGALQAACIAVHAPAKTFALQGAGISEPGRIDVIPIGRQIVRDGSPWIQRACEGLGATCLGK